MINFEYLYSQVEKAIHVQHRKAPANKWSKLTSTSHSVSSIHKVWKTVATHMHHLKHFTTPFLHQPFTRTLQLNHYFSLSRSSSTKLHFFLSFNLHRNPIFHHTNQLQFVIHGGSRRRPRVKKGPIPVGLQLLSDSWPNRRRCQRSSVQSSLSPIELFCRSNQSHRSRSIQGRFRQCPTRSQDHVASFSSEHSQRPLFLHGGSPSLGGDAVYVSRVFAVHNRVFFP